jgi:hypothetical protein
MNTRESHREGKPRCIGEAVSVKRVEMSLVEQGSGSTMGQEGLCVGLGSLTNTTTGYPSL